MTDLAEILKKDPCYPTTPCYYCAKPVGYGDHERYCSQNPDNLARSCGYTGCHNPGNIAYEEGEWICRDHADWRNANENLRSRKGNISFAQSQLKSLHDKIHEIHCKLPKMYQELEESEENLKVVKFKLALHGTKVA